MVRNRPPTAEEPLRELGRQLLAEVPVESETSCWEEVLGEETPALALAAYRQSVLRQHYLWTQHGSLASPTNPHVLVYEAAEQARCRQRELVQSILREHAAAAGSEPRGVRCSKCGSTDIQIEIGQTRSADEGSTVFCLCLRCQKRWRM